MEEKYIQAIKAGIIGGVLFIILSIISLASALVSIWVVKAALGCLVLLIAIIIAAGTGALAVRFARAGLNNLTDAAVVSAVAGLIAGVIYAVINMFTAIVRSIIVPNEVNDILSQWGSQWSQYGWPTTVPAAPGPAWTWIGQCCCAPFLIVAVIIVAAIGGVLYGALVAKLP